MKCPNCGEGYTGYIVKKKNLWYYKCRTKGCCANKNAGKVNEQFTEFLKNYQIKEEYLSFLIDEILDAIEGMDNVNRERQKELALSLKEVQKKIDTVEEKYYLGGEMSKETYGKFIQQLTTEKDEILILLSNCGSSSSNLENFIEKIVMFSSKLAVGWASSSVGVKEELQKLIFPSGVSYDVKKEAFRTGQVNELFAVNASLNSLSEVDLNNNGGNKATVSNLVGMTALEPIFMNSNFINYFPIRNPQQASILVIV